MPRARKYPEELIERGVRLVFESGRPVAEVARDLGVGQRRCASACARPRPTAAAAGSAHQRGARGDQEAAQGELRAAPRERDPEGRIGVFRERARRRPTEVSAFIDEHREPLRGRADLPDLGRVGVRLLPARDRRAFGPSRRGRAAARADPRGARGQLRGYGYRRVHAADRRERARGTQPGRAADAPHGHPGREAARQAVADDDPRSSGAAARDLVKRDFTAPAPDRRGSATSPICAAGRAGCSSRSSSTSTAG